MRKNGQAPCLHRTCSPAEERGVYQVIAQKKCKIFAMLSATKYCVHGGPLCIKWQESGSRAEI